MEATHEVAEEEATLTEAEGEVTRVVEVETAVEAEEGMEVRDIF